MISGEKATEEDYYQGLCKGVSGDSGQKDRREEGFNNLSEY